ncbi:MAG: universal stress protein, partial [Herbiconiux sp.]|nr:universal stress protein [Herbiconiux sp.]
MAGTILVGYDGTPAARRALDWALRHAEAIRVDVDLLFVTDTSWDSEAFTAAPLLHRQGEVALSAAAFHADSKAPHVRVVPRQVSGEPVRTLCAEA